jgi:hypothetical protein
VFYVERPALDRPRRALHATGGLRIDCP